MNSYCVNISFSWRARVGSEVCDNTATIRMCVKAWSTVEALGIAVDLLPTNGTIDHASIDLI